MHTTKPVLLITDQNEFPEDTWQIISIGTSHPEGQPDDIPLTLIPSPADSGSLFEAIQHACTRIPLETEYKQRIPRVLVVEDNTINRMLSQRYLKNLKADVETAEDGREAVNMANRSVYDLIFMDCQMPVMDGFQATREIRRSNLNQSTPIIALTSLESEMNGRPAFRLA